MIYRKTGGIKSSLLCESGETTCHDERERGKEKEREKEKKRENNSYLSESNYKDDKKNY